MSEILLAGIGLATTSVETMEELADDLARRVGVERDAMERALARAGLARREEVEDLALRVAQLEHRLRLLERDHVA